MWLAIALLEVFLVTAKNELGSTWSRSTTARCAWIEVSQDDYSCSHRYGAEWLMGFLPGARGLRRDACTSATSMPVSHTCVSAEFSAPMPTEPLYLLVLPAEPLDACTPLDSQAMHARQNTLDTTEPGGALSKNTVAVVAARGGCSFATKAQNVAKYGAAMLIVVDHATNAKAMPMGDDPATSEASSKLLSVMVGADADPQAMITALATKAVYYSTSYTPSDRSTSDDGPLVGENLKAGMALIFFTSLVFMSRWALSPADTQDTDEGVWLAALTLALFLAAVSWVRLQASMRTLTIASGVTAAGITSGTQSVYDHRETDEVVLRFLVDSVKEHGLSAGYSLTAFPEGAALRRLLRLAPANYDFPLFHHPPCFVLLAFIAEDFCGLPSPALPTLLAAISSILSVRLAGQYLGLGLEGKLWAAAIHTLCPLTWFTSQKFWLDNALAAASTAALATAATAIVHATTPVDSSGSIKRSSGSNANDVRENSKAQSSMKTRRYRNLHQELSDKDEAASSTPKQSNTIPAIDSTANTHETSIYWALIPAAHSAVLLALALWCKLTAALATPALVVVAFVAPSVEPSTDGSATNCRAKNGANLSCVEYGHLVVVAARLCVAVVTVAALYAPWLLWYNQATGLWLPPAIPSPAMLQHSTFVAAALGRNAAYYPAALLRLNPAYWFAALPPCLALVRWIRGTVISLLANPETSSRSIHASSEGTKGRQATASAAAVNDNAKVSAPFGTCVLWLWVASCVGGMSALGVWGSAGFQMRFVLPATPALAALAAAGVVQYRCVAPVAAVLLAIAAAHSLLFGLLFAPLAADIGMPHQSLWAAVLAARRTPLPYPPPAPLQDAWELLEHYGVNTS